MSVAELKEKIIAKVSETNDESVLEDYWLVVSSAGEVQFDFTPKELQQFKEIEQEIEAGNYYSTRQVVTNAHTAIAAAMKKIEDGQGG